jgi:predicted aspartyl protease
MPFRIPVRLTDEDPPFVSTTVFLPEIGAMARADFLVDTGASDLFLSEDCLKELGIDLKDLRRSRIAIGGAGGTVGAFSLENIALIIPTEEPVSWEVHLDSALVIQNPTKRRARNPIGVPNLMGRKFMRRNLLALDLDFGRNIGYLEAPD